MKKLLLLVVLITCKNHISAQVIFGDAVGSAADKTSVLMEFSTAGNRGLILPYVTDKTAITTAGSIIFDASTASAAKAKYYNGTAWIDLSVQPANATSYLTIQPTARENTNSKVIIGSNTSSADGILVLESSSKAMVLPIATSYQNIINPAPGTMVLLSNGPLKTLAVYNGEQWSFWSY
ncbi:hypothetical protein ACFOWU_04110 [Epilithonimonas zeae]|uniref:Uncharacterized protein n=1 Tax=Epilithonimonas zeae TaxID=1416779 RepID=A0A1N6EV74_9FLAO|nr:hypothetical protein [Epilithonimonas zeae]SIN86823.1 hypothetical protein SAMN05444409_0870 [Epilithonimonas zeae]